jgi:hypothetical protein
MVMVGCREDGPPPKRWLARRFRFRHARTLALLIVVRSCCAAIIVVAMQQFHPHMPYSPSLRPPSNNPTMFPILLANLVSNALTPRSPQRRRRPPGRAGKGSAKPVNLALQGGGAHGAFTWGVLDRLLEESWLRIDGISGTSAGAMNAAVLIDGHAARGAAGGREALAVC